MKVHFQGIEYRSLSKCYKANESIAKVSLVAVRKRLKSGFSIDEALLMDNNQGVQSKFGSHTIEGIEYKNLREIAKAYDVTSDAVYKRYARGFRGDDLVPKKKRKNYAPLKVEPKPLKNEVKVAGEKYKSEHQACVAFGVKYVTFRKRRARGLTVEQALGIVKVEDRRQRKKKKYCLDGEYYSVSEFSKKFSVPTNTIFDRLYRGASIEQAVGLADIKEGELITQSQYKTQAKTRRIKRKKIEAFGRVFKTYKELADAFSLPAHVVRFRITRYGYSPEEAVISEGKARKVVVRGKEYKSKAEAAEAHGITLPILLGRMNGGLNLEQALRLEEYDTAHTIIFEGQKYRNLEHLANAKGISVKAIRGRLNSGLNLEQAINAGAKILNKGRFNKTLLERETELSQSDAVLYFVKLKIEEKIYYKVGITTKSVEDRLKYKRLQYETITIVKDTLRNAFELEQEILSLIKDKKANISAESLDGYTEVIELTDEEVRLVASLINEYKDQRIAQLDFLPSA